MIVVGTMHAWTLRRYTYICQKFLSQLCGHQTSPKKSRKVQKTNRADLFKPNDVVSYHVLKISNINIPIIPIYFVEKNERSFCTAKASIIFSNTNIILNVFGYKYLIRKTLNELTS